MITAAQIQRLRSRFESVEDIEDDGMDDGRFFIHLKQRYDFNTDPCQVIHTKSFGGYREAFNALLKSGIAK